MARQRHLSKAWLNMNARAKRLGVQVCLQWRDYEVFSWWAHFNGYQDGHHLMRRDIDGAFEADNCFWVDPKEKHAVNRHTRRVTAWDETKTIAAWHDDPRCAVGDRLLYMRIAHGWEPERAISTPADMVKNNPNLRYLTITLTLSFPDWCKLVNKSEATVEKRLLMGWNIERAMTEPVGPTRQKTKIRLITAFGETKCVSAWARDSRCVLSMTGLRARIENGWDAEQAITVPPNSVGNRRRNLPAPPVPPPAPAFVEYRVGGVTLPSQSMFRELCGAFHVPRA